MTQRTKLLLAAFGVALVVFLWTTVRPALRADDGGAATTIETRERASSRRGRRGSAEPVREVVEVEVARLEVQAGEYQAGRNPFIFQAPPPPPPPPPPPGPTAEELAARRAAEEAARRAAEEAARLAAGPVAPKPPPIEFAYLGSFGPPHRRIAVFADGESIYNVLEGDVIEGKFRLVRIGFESVELKYVDFPQLPATQLPVGAEGI